jgi:vesicular inhibitory amino acid transporter
LKDNEEICSNNGLFIESDDNEEKELRREENDGNESTYSNDSNENLVHRKPSSF